MMMDRILIIHRLETIREVSRYLSMSALSNLHQTILVLILAIGIDP